MLRLNRRALMIFTLVIVMGWASNAGAHRRGGLPLVHPDILPAAQTQAPPEATTGPPSLEADSYWQRLLAQEQADDLGEAIKTGLALANIFPQSRRCSAALLKAGELAQQQGKTEEALELFDLVSSLIPGTPDASQARLTASTLMLARDLRQRDPVQSLRQFLGRTSHLAPGYSPELFQETLKTGWQAVASQVRGAASPLPLSLVEEVLSLWDLQPKELAPPEAARLLATLLQKKGLVEEAQRVLAEVSEKNRSNQPDMPKSYSLKQSELFPCQADLLGAPHPTSLKEEEQKFQPPWQCRWQAGVESVGTSGEDLLGWFLPRPAHAAWLARRLPSLGTNLMPSWSPLQPDRPRLELTERCLPESSTPQATQAPQPVVAQTVGHAQGPFSQYCRGVNRLQNGHPEEAQTTFQELAQNHEPFWQSLAQVRLADLELSRLQAEPAP